LPSHCAVTLLPCGWTFEADPARTLLDAAAAAGIRLPAACRNGTCRTCLCRSRSGAVAYGTSRPGLTTDELEDGWLLPCIAHAVTDLCIEAPAAEPLEPEPPRPIMVGPR
jgi:ferredoxin